MASPHFSVRELSCGKGACPHCGGRMEVTPEALATLERLRASLQTPGKKIPIVLNSAFRCPAHNAEVGGKPDSKHLAGTAFDVALKGDFSRGSLIAHAKLAGFRGFGQYDSFVHMDLGPPRVWDNRTTSEGPKP